MTNYWNVKQDALGERDCSVATANCMKVCIPEVEGSKLGRLGPTAATELCSQICACPSCCAGDNSLCTLWKGILPNTCACPWFNEPGGCCGGSNDSNPCTGACINPLCQNICKSACVNGKVNPNSPAMSQCISCQVNPLPWVNGSSTPSPKKGLSIGSILGIIIGSVALLIIIIYIVLARISR